MWDSSHVHGHLPRGLDQHPHPCCLGSAPTCALLSPLPTASTPTIHSLAAPNPGSPLTRGTAYAPRPELQSSAVRSQLCSRLSLCIRGPLCLERPPTTSPSSKTVPSNKASSDVNSSWKPTQISPCFRPLHFPSLTGPLRSCHSCLASCAFVPLPLALLPPSPCSKRNLPSFTLCCVSWLLFSCLCHVSLSSRPLLMLVLPLQCPSLITSWQKHSHLSRPSSIVSCEQSLFPTCHPCTSADSEIHCHVPAQPMALFCLGSDVHLPRTCLRPEPAGGLSQGLLGLGLGGQKWKLPLLAPTVCRTL